MNKQEKLIKRIDQNFADYRATILKLDGKDIFEKAEEIAAYTQAHRYLTGHHNYEPGELDYLLLFQNPLEVVANHYLNELGNVNDVLELTVLDICDKQDELEDYPLIKKREEPER